MDVFCIDFFYGASLDFVYVANFSFFEFYCRFFAFEMGAKLLKEKQELKLVSVPSKLTANGLL